MRSRVYRTSAAAAAVLAVGWLLAAPAQSAEKVSHVVIPLTGTVPVADSGAGCSHADTVTIEDDSNVHVVSVPQRNVVHANLSSVEGAGTSDEDYVGVGAHRFTSVTIPPGGGTVTLTHTFSLVHTEDGCADSPLPVTLKLVFSASGKLQSSSTATTP